MKNWIGLRPRAVVGNGDQTVLPRLLELIRGQKVLIPGKGDAILDVTCMENFLDAVESAISPQESAKGKFYNISNGDPRPFSELIMTLAENKFGSIKARHIPLLPLRISASFSSFFHRVPSFYLQSHHCHDHERLQQSPLLSLTIMLNLNLIL